MPTIYTQQQIVSLRDFAAEQMPCTAHSIRFVSDRDSVAHRLDPRICQNVSPLDSQSENPLGAERTVTFPGTRIHLATLAVGPKRERHFVSIAHAVADTLDHAILAGVVHTLPSCHVAYLAILATVDDAKEHAVQIRDEVENVASIADANDLRSQNEIAELPGVRILASAEHCGKVEHATIIDSLP